MTCTDTDRRPSAGGWRVPLAVAAMFWVVPILGATYLSSPSISHVNWGAFWFALTQMVMTHPLTLPVLAVVALRLAQGRGVSPRLRGWIYAAAIWSLIVLGIGLGG